MSTNAYDYETPNGVEATYRARAVHASETITSYSDWSDTDLGIWMNASTFWLKHPTDPSLNLRVKLRSPTGESVKREAREGRFQPAGDSATVVVSDTRGSETGVVTFRCDTTEEKDELEALADTNVSLLLQCRRGDNEPDRWLALGEHSRSRLIDKAWVEGWWIEYPWIEVAPPDAPLSA